MQLIEAATPDQLKKQLQEDAVGRAHVEATETGLSTRATTCAR